MSKLLAEIQKPVNNPTVYDSKNGTSAALANTDTEYTRGFKNGYNAGNDYENFPEDLTNSEYDIGFHNGYLEGQKVAKAEIEKFCPCSLCDYY